MISFAGVTSVFSQHVPLWSFRRLSYWSLMPLWSSLVSSISLWCSTRLEDSCSCSRHFGLFSSVELRFWNLWSYLCKHFGSSYLLHPQSYLWWFWNQVLVIIYSFAMHHWITNHLSPRLYWDPSPNLPTVSAFRSCNRFEKSLSFIIRIYRVTIQEIW